MFMVKKMSNIQDIFNKFYPHYKEEYHPNYMQIKAAKDIMNCKSAALGGHAHTCDQCGHIEIWYNSCRNRHCPTCQAVNKEIWIDERSKDIINTSYFHVVFTLPKQLQTIVYQNQKLLYALMYKAVSQTLIELCTDKKYLDAQPGFFSILHTWGQNIDYHPHIHTVLLNGGLNKIGKWKDGKKKFFIPVKVLSKKFRGKFLYFLKQYYKENKLEFYGDNIIYENASNFKELLDECYKIDWYSYTKKTFSHPLAVIKYLGRYTHRIAISNHRIISIDKEHVTFKAKDYKNNSKDITVTMKGVEFIRRFLMHVLPKGFVKIRYYGVLANRNKKTKLSLCKYLTKTIATKTRFEGLSRTEIISLIVGKDITLCPVCKTGYLNIKATLFPEVFT